LFLDRKVPTSSAARRARYHESSNSRRRIENQIKCIKRWFGNEVSFLFTYGDGASDIDIQPTIKFHRPQEKLAMVTSVLPLARFGAASMLFRERPLTTSMAMKLCGNESRPNNLPKCVNS